jgi:diguanylate cyclase (GGDEF)-like protein/PAS domain S-box-containing protein
MSGLAARLRRLGRPELVAAKPALGQTPVMALALLEAALDAAPIGFVVIDPRTGVTSVNEGVAEYLGGSLPIEQAEQLIDLVHPADRHLIDSVFTATETVRVLLRIVHPTRGLRHVQLSSAPVVHEDSITATVVVLVDVDDQIAHGRQLEQFRAIADTTSDVIAIASLHGDEDYLNPAGREMFGVETLALQTLGHLVARDDHPLLFGHAFRAAGQGGTWSGELAFIDRRGIRRPMSVVMMGLAGTDGRSSAFALICRDVSEQRQLESRLAFAAGHDPLTGLPNRQRLLDTLSSDLDQDIPLAVLFGGLDGFKLVNDSLGHDVGDDTLRAVAARLVESARPDDMVARLGGDEFVIVCRSSPVDRDEARAMAQRCIDAVGAPIVIGGREHVVAMSIGITLRSEQATASELLQEADLAMHAAKVLGRGRHEVFDSAMRVRSDERVQLESDLRLALERGEIELRYQPIVDTATGRVKSFEALARWMHPTRGMLMPREFMPLVEAAGFALSFGEIVIRQATVATVQLRAIQPDVTTAVNMSPQQLLDHQLVSVTADALAVAGLPPSALTIEITEEIVMDELHAARPRLEALRALGVRFAIDDFGTGYSNLSMLRQFAADYVKIDRSLVEGDATLLRLVLSLTNELGFASIAEGVETVEQLGLLQVLGCSLAQGYYIAEPLELDDALSFLDESQRSAGSDAR